MISKELAGKIFGFHVIVKIYTRGSNVKIVHCPNVSSKNYMETETVNIYELANLVKVWVFESTNCPLVSGLATNQHSTISHKIGDGMALLDSKPYYANTEPEAVFKAGEHVFKGIR